MLPSLVEKDIEEGVRSFIEREFPVATPGFGNLVQDFLKKSDNYVKGPWLEVRRPFRSSDEPMANLLPELSGHSGVAADWRPYQHQMMSFKRLVMPGGQSTIVATGTGSGKTECFMLPMLDYCLQAKREGKSGIKAIIIYPMNALATDQSKRVADYCGQIKEQTGIQLSAGLFVGAPGFVAKKMSEKQCISDKETLRQNPPDILLTNYKMLDYLLLRDKDRSLWRDTSADTLKYLIVDELHTFDGAQGTDLACLIRRLRDFLHLDDSLACVGTSATLGGGNGLKDLQQYATDVFGTSFADEESIIREDRLSVDEYFNHLFEELDERKSIGQWPTREAFDALIGLPANVEPGAYIEAALKCWFPENVYRINRMGSKAWKDGAYELSKLLPFLDAFQRLMSAEDGVINLSELAHEWKVRIASLSTFTEEEIVLMLRSLIALVSMARSDKNGKKSFLTVRVQLWVRELSNMVATVEATPRMMSNADRQEDSPLALPLVTCSECNATAWGAVEDQADKISSSLQKFYKSWFGREANARLLYPIKREEFEEMRRRYPREIFLFCPHDKATQWIDHNQKAEDIFVSKCRICGKEHEAIVVRKPNSVVTTKTVAGIKNKMSHRCPWCDARDRLRIFGARSTTISSAMWGHLGASSTVEDGDKKLISFSDSVQDAAHRAGFMEARSYRFTLRQAVAGFIREQDKNQNISLLAFLKEIADFWENKIGGYEVLINDSDESINSRAEDIAKARFVTTFLSTDMMWRKAWLDFVQAAKESVSAGETSRKDQYAFVPELRPINWTEKQKTPWETFCGNVKDRLAWEAFCELTIKSHNGRTIEQGGIGSLAPNHALVVEAGHLFQQAIKERVGGFEHFSDESFVRFIEGFLDHQKNRGAFNLEAIDGFRDFNTYVKTGNEYVYLRRSLVLPNYGGSYRPPSPLILANIKGLRQSDYFDVIVPRSQNGETWYSKWIEAVFPMGEQSLALRSSSYVEDVFRCLLDALREVGMMKFVPLAVTPAADAYMLNPECWIIKRDLKKAVCPECGRWHLIPTETSETWAAMPCLSQCCRAHSHRIDEVKEAVALYQGKPIPTVAREHTANIDSEDRGFYEKSFINKKEPWDVNLLSATPTLEMGIDIGDLSSVLLASMPPGQANYIQRIGRAGRRDGNALAMTVCGNNPHARYFWANPEAMLTGAVQPPGVFLHAMAVLERQLLAFSITRWVTDVDGAKLPEKVKDLLSQAEKTTYSPSAFPQGLFDYLEEKSESLLNDFCAEFKDQQTQKTFFSKDEKDRLRLYLTGDPEKAVASLKDRLMGKVQTLLSQRESSLNRVKEYMSALKKRKADPKDDERENDIAELKSNIDSLRALIKKQFQDKDTLNVLTDEGLLPNYAFPEEGITVDGIIMKVRGQDTASKKKDDVKSEGKDRGVYKRFTFQRAASSGLLEVSPDSTFYVNDYAMHIDQVELDKDKSEPWRFCPSCQHAEPDMVLNQSSACPVCGDPMWADASQRRDVLQMKTVYAWADMRRDRIRDDRDERAMKPQAHRMLVEVPPSVVSKSYVTGDETFGFGFEYLPTVKIRDFNFGPKDKDDGQSLEIASETVNAPGFTVCKSCGRLRQQVYVSESGVSYTKGRAQHDFHCSYYKNPEKAEWIEGLVLYRQIESEALRIRVPAGLIDYAAETVTASLAAALRIGLHKYFKGNVDHLRIVDMAEPDEEGKRMVRYILIHDTVPGGTGYLKELLAEPKNLIEIFKVALKVMTECPCGQDEESDGCYRCVYQYANSSTRKYVSRRCATQLVSAILETEGSLREGRIRRHGGDGGDSELEARFIRKLANGTRYVTSMIPCQAGGEQTHYVIRMDTGMLWRMDLQVDYKGDRPSRPDFVLRPAKEQDRTPSLEMAIFTDGWRYHADIVEDDTAKRQSILNTGYRVWTLGWEDIDHAQGADAPWASLLDESAVDTAIMRNVYGQMATREGWLGIQELKTEWLNQIGNFERLIEWMRHPLEAQKAARAIMFLAGFSALLDENGQMKPTYQPGASVKAAIAGEEKEPVFSMRANPVGGWKAVWHLKPNYRVGLFADAVFYKDRANESATETIAESLMQFWSLANLSQFCGTPLWAPVSDPAAEADYFKEYPWAKVVENAGYEDSLPEDQAVGEDVAAWQEVRDMLPEELLPLAETLEKRGVPLPQVGIDYVDPRTQTIITTMDLWWPDVRIGVISKAAAGLDELPNMDNVVLFDETISADTLIDAIDIAL